MNMVLILGGVVIIVLIVGAAWAVFTAPNVPTEEQRQHDAVAFDRNEPMTMGKQSIINRGGSRWANIVGRLGRKRK